MLFVYNAFGIRQTKKYLYKETQHISEVNLHDKQGKDDRG